MSYTIPENIGLESRVDHKLTIGDTVTVMVVALGYCHKQRQQEWEGKLHLSKIITMIQDLAGGVERIGGSVVRALTYSPVRPCRS